MARVTLAPDMLYLSTWDRPEREYLGPLLAKLRKAGYENYREPIAGAFAMPTVAAEGGWEVADIACSDTSLYACVVGRLLAGKPLEELDVRLDDEPLELAGTPVEQAAEILWVQLLARLEKRAPGAIYWEETVTDLMLGRKRHVASIKRGLERSLERLHGITFFEMGPFEFVEMQLDDPRAVIVSNPPTYKCLAPHERVLTADLRWVAAGDIAEGDRLTAFDEWCSASGRRRLREAVVERSESARENLVRMRFESGRSIVCSAQHPMLVDPYGYTATGRRWVKASESRDTFALRLFEVWDDPSSWARGWLAGVFDGEGHLRLRSDGAQLTITQKPGRVLDMAARLLAEEGFSLGSSRSTNADQIHVLGGVSEVARALGSIRPVRLLSKWHLDGRGFRSIDKDRIVAVESLGEGDVQVIQTDTGTLIGEGYAMHNSAYEKFFDTDGRLTFKGPAHEVWDPAVDQARLAGMLADAKALAIIQQQAVPRAAAGEPVYARHLSPGQYVYLWSNRPEEVLGKAGGLRVRPRNPAEISALDIPTIPEDWVFREDAQVSVLPIATSVAAWYKQRWLHRLAGAEGAYNFVVLVDGYVAGVGGYSFKAIQTPYPGVDDKVWAGATILRFACGAPHAEHRLTRLITKVALQRESLLVIAKSLPSVMLMAAGSDKFVTTEYSRHPESKGLRGLMKLVDRRKDSLDGYRLVYWAPMGELDAAGSYAAWLTDDHRWLAKRRSADVEAPDAAEAS